MFTDPASGRPYYVNTMTGKTSWNPPPGTTQAAAPAPQQSTRPLDPGWEERVDPGTGRTFYIDHINKRTSWERPSSNASPKPSYTQPSYAQPPRTQPSSFSSGASGRGNKPVDVDRDAELARELAAQWEAEDESASAAAPASTPTPHGSKEKEGWASDADVVQCFLTGTRFSMVNRKHHCRYCGQIFVSEVCKKTSKIPGKGDEQVRVCDVCADQLERGDPVCISKQVAQMRSSSERDRQAGAKTLADWAAMDPQFAVPNIVSALETLRLPELISQLLLDSAPQTQAAAARLLAAMLKYPSHAEALQQGELLEPLMKALQGSSSDGKISAVTALVGLTTTEAGRAQLRSAGGLDMLIDVLLTGGNHKLVEGTCQVLANLCEDNTDDWKRLLQNGAVFSLTSMIGSSSTSLQEAVLTLLAMLCAHNECREQVADAGCMPSLAVTLGSSRSALQRTALALTQQLSASKRACSAMLDAGVAAPLAAMLANSHIADAEVVAAVLECIQALAVVGLPQAQTAVRNAGAVPHLIQLMSHEQPRVSSIAGSLVAELCPGDVRSSEQLFESGGIVMLAEQLLSNNTRSQLQALSALSQLSSAKQQAAAIVDNGCVEPLLELLEHPNQELKSYAAITFGNLCSSNAIPMHMLQRASVLPHIVMLLSSSNALAKAPAAGAVASMLANPSLRESVFNMGGLPPLVNLLQADTDTSYHAVQAVAQFAADERYRPMVAAEPGVVELTALLGSHLQHVQQCALSAIANVSFVPSAVAPLADSGALAQLGMLLFNKDEQVQRMCLTAMCNILGGAGHSLPRAADGLLQVGGHMALLTQLSSHSPEAQSQAAMSIGHMSKYKPALQASLSADAVPVLAKLLHSAHPSVQQQAIYALGVMAAGDEAAASGIQLAGSVAPLTTLLLSSPSPDVKSQLTYTLANAVRGNWRPVFNVGGFQALLDVLAVGTEAVQQDVSSSLGELLQDVHQRRALLSDMNSVSAIVSLLSSPNLTTQQNAAVALAALCQEAAAREVLYRQGTLSHVIRSLTAANVRQEDGGTMSPSEAAARVSMLRIVAAFAADERYCTMLRITIQPLVALLAKADVAVLTHAAQAVMSLSRSESNRDALRDAGATRRLSELLLHAEAAVQECAVQGIANLGVQASDASTFLSSGWHLPLISLLSSDSMEVQASAAAVLGSLACAAEFRQALMSDGALQPILQLLHAPALPTRTAAVRALAIMSQQLMSPALPPDDSSTLQLVDALFETSTIPKLLEVLAEDVAATGETGEQQLIGVLLLLQNLAGGHGHVRPRLVEAGAVEALVRFLQARVVPHDKAKPHQPASSSTSGEVLAAAALTLANLVLAPGGTQRLAAVGDVSALLPFLQSRSQELQAATARAIGNMAHDAVQPHIFRPAIPPLVALVARLSTSADATFALSNLFALQQDLFSESLLAHLAPQLLVPLESADADAQQGALFLLRQMSLHAAGRRALAAAGATAKVRAVMERARGVDAASGGQFDLLIGMMSVTHADTPPPAAPVRDEAPPPHQPPQPPPPQYAPHHPPHHSPPVAAPYAPPPHAPPQPPPPQQHYQPPPPQYAPPPQPQYSPPPNYSTHTPPQPPPPEMHRQLSSQSQPPQPFSQPPPSNQPPAPSPQQSFTPPPPAQAQAPPQYAPPMYGAPQPQHSEPSYFGMAALEPQVAEVPPLIDLNSLAPNQAQGLL